MNSDTMKIIAFVISCASHVENAICIVCKKKFKIYEVLHFYMVKRKLVKEKKSQIEHLQLK